MTPKTKAQIAVAAVQARLPKIGPEVIAWAKDTLLGHVVVMLKSGKATCLDCGHVWHEDLQAWKLNLVGGQCCPGCGVAVEFEFTKKRKFHEWHYFNVITTFEGWQIIRLFKVSGSYRVGEPAQTGVCEIGQMWLNESKCYDFGMFTGYGGYWCGFIEMRTGSGGFSYDCETYPKMKILPVLKKRGFKKGFHGLYPYRMFKMLLTESFFETLFKAKQYDLMRHFADAYKRRELHKYWASIKICLRNKYVVKNVSDWTDYIDLLDFFGKDLRNAKYVCPQNLKQVHDYYVDKKTKLSKFDISDLEEKKYQRDKKAFLGLSFSEGALEVKVLENLQEFIDESKKHKHCVWTNRYDQKAESLVLSARVAGELTETVEVNLSQLKIVQSRGRGNAATPFNKDIVNLVNKNMQVIEKLACKGA